MSVQSDVVGAAHRGGWSPKQFSFFEYLYRHSSSGAWVRIFLLGPDALDEAHVDRPPAPSFKITNVTTLVAFLNRGGRMTRNNFKGHGFRRFVEKNIAYDRFFFYGVDGQRKPVKVFASAGSTGLIWLHYASSGQKFMTIGTAQKFYAEPVA